jgi:hypothetical protein
MSLVENSIYLINDNIKLNNITQSITNAIIIGVTNDTTISVVPAIDEHFTYYIPPSIFGEGDFAVGYFIKGCKQLNLSGYKCQERTLTFINPLFNICTTVVMGSLKFKTYNDISTTQYAGLLATSTDSNSVINNISLECHNNINIDINGSNSVGGFIGINAGTINNSSLYIKNASNINISSNSGSNSNVYGCGLFVGLNNNIITNCELLIKNVKKINVNSVTTMNANNSGSFIGSTFGIVFGCKSTITNGSTINITSDGGNAGGFIGFDRTQTDANNKLTLLNNGNVCISSSSSSGGFIGEASEGNNITNCEVVIDKNLTVTIGSNSDSGFSGGFIGQNASPMQKCKLILQNNGIININANTVGGFIGQNDFTIVTDCESIIRDNNTINITGKKYCGGFIGFNQNPIINSKLIITGCKTVNIIVLNNNFETYCGGFVAYTTNNIIDCKLLILQNKTVNVISNGANKSLCGGFVGYSQNSITGCELTVMQVEIININAINSVNDHSYCGGFVAHTSVTMNCCVKFNYNKYVNIGLKSTGNTGSLCAFVTNLVYNTPIEFMVNQVISINGINADPYTLILNGGNTMIAYNEICAYKYNLTVTLNDTIIEKTDEDIYAKKRDECRNIVYANFL